MARMGRNERCHCGSGAKYKRCCEEKDQNRLREVKDAASGSAMQLVIETDAGLAVRSVSAAMPRRLVGEQGKAAEEATHDAAAIWGLADFVFEPSVRQRASGVRELGDGIVLVGEIGIVLQVKSREELTENDERERRWIAKQCKKALSQGAGTIRELKREPCPVTNLRGRKVLLDGTQYRWMTAVILDHDSPPEEMPVRPSDRAVILLRRDWDFLFEQLKSTHGVARYLERVVGEEATLGSEPLRYYELAEADAKAKPKVLGKQFVVEGTRQVSEPLLPMAPLAANDEVEHRFFRTVMEDIAGIRLEEMSEEARLRALADLDRLLTQQRAEAGRFFLDGLSEARKIKRPEVLWKLRRISGEGTTQLAVGVCSSYDKEIAFAFSAWLQLRHHEFTNRLGTEETMTVGVLVTPRDRPGPRWDTSMTVVRGTLALSDEELAAFMELWGNEEDIALREGRIQRKAA